MCKISDFSSPLEIAFGLSALFYYIELRTIAEQRTKAALMGHDAALKRSIQTFLSMRIKTVAVSLAQAVAGLRLLWEGHPLGAVSLGSQLLALYPKLKSIIFQALKMAVLYVSLNVLKSTRYVVHILVVCSVIASLGSLLYSGYHPEEEINCSTITFIIVASYVSIAWNLIVYFIYIPAIAQMVNPTVPDDPPLC